MTTFTILTLVAAITATGLLIARSLLVNGAPRVEIKQSEENL